MQRRILCSIYAYEIPLLENSKLYKISAPGAMNIVVVSLAFVFLLVFFILYFVYGVGEDGHLLSVSMVVSKNKPVGTFVLSISNMLMFMCLYPEYEAFAWMQWILGQFVISYNTDKYEAIHTFFFWVLSAIDILVVINLMVNHKMLYYALPFFLVIFLFAIFIVFNVLAYNVFTYNEKNTDNPLMHTLQSILEISFLFSVFFFLTSYYYINIYPLEPLCKIPQ